MVVAITHLRADVTLIIISDCRTLSLVVMDDSEISILDSMRFDFLKNLDFELRANFTVY